VWVQIGPESFLMHRPLSHAAGPNEQLAPAWPPPEGKQMSTWVPASEPSSVALRQANPSGQPALQGTVHTREVPTSRQVPVWHGGRPGVQSSPNRPPNGAHTPEPESGPT